ncbi:hypothetical protein B0J18DRAFT_426615 [Chaetomium sp. MPI-SDFR-AT-0129]|nr:hypothetical protein B0J18DRAFT_426615 [Chaetomium sp. MPI-SDFR-AT-0129]
MPDYCSPSWFRCWRAACCFSLSSLAFLFAARIDDRVYINRTPAMVNAATGAMMVRGLMLRDISHSGGVWCYCVSRLLRAFNPM